MNIKIMMVIGALALWASSVPAAAAEPLAVLLQKGIFAEETEGNLDAAIKIYKQITAEAATNRLVVAQAQYRLGVCYQKKGNKELAIGVLTDLLKQSPAEVALGEKARRLLAALGQAPSGNITIRQVPLAAARVYSVSLDGQLVAYRPKENSSMVIQETTTGKTWTAISATDGRNVWYAIISPDGRRIAYQVKIWSIYVAKIDGSEAKLVYDDPRKSDCELELRGWSADGRQLIVSHCPNSGPENGILRINTLEVETGTMKEVKRWPVYPYLGKACVASSGRYLAYRAGAESESRRSIHVLDLESAIETTLIDKEVADVVGWSPKDDSLLFLSARSGATGLWSIPVRAGRPGGQPELVKANVGDIHLICVTRDGSIYYREDRSSQYESGSSEYVALATADFATGEVHGQPRRATDRYLGKQAVPVWSKDGQTLMFGVPGVQKRFVTVSLASGEHKEFPVSDVFTAIPEKYVWSPDGAFLLVLSYRTEGGLGIYRYQLASGSAEMLVPRIAGRTWPTQPRFAPDGNSFYYAQRTFSTNNWRDCVIRRDLRSGGEEIVYDSPEKLQIDCPYELSPDGKRLAIVTAEKNEAREFVVALKVRDVSGSETKEVARMAPRENVASLVWTSDGKRLVYTKERPGNDDKGGPQIEVWSTAVDSGQSVELKLSLPGIRDLSIHPDGRQIAFGAGLSSGQDLWVMEGLTARSVGPSARTTSSGTGQMR